MSILPFFVAIDTHSYVFSIEMIINERPLHYYHGIENKTKIPLFEIVLLLMKSLPYFFLTVQARKELSQARSTLFPQLVTNAFQCWKDVYNISYKACKMLLLAILGLINLISFLSLSFETKGHWD